MTDSKLIVALDFPTLHQADGFLKKIKGADCRLKVGKELFTAEGPRVIDLIKNYNFEIFLDLKFHDIPNTVNKAIKATCAHGVWMVNVHASGGKAMLDAAHDAIAGSNHKPLLIAVTVLTSFDENSFDRLGFKMGLKDQIIHLSSLAKESNLDGIVCSANDIASISSIIKDENFLFVTPGIRLKDNSNDDQKRINTPAEAIKNGSDYIVIGRPITEHDNPLDLIRKINAQI